MYSRYSDRNDPPLRIPDHYSGCAFSKKAPTNEPRHYLEIAKPTPPEQPVPPPPPLPLPPPADVPPPPPEHHYERDNRFKLSHPLAALSNGLDFDQLLILGLILLLWGNNEDRDIVMWLSLLLLWQ